MDQIDTIVGLNELEKLAKKEGTICIALHGIEFFVFHKDDEGDEDHSYFLILEGKNGEDVILVNKQSINNVYTVLEAIHRNTESFAEIIIDNDN